MRLAPAILGLVLLALPTGVARAADLNPTQRFHYEISWGFLHVGRSTMEVTPTEDGQVSIFTGAWSNSKLSRIYPVEDVARSIVESAAHPLALNYTLVTREGRHRKDRELIFDREAGSVTFFDHIENTETPYEIPAEVFDPLGAFQYTRMNTLVVGRSVFVPMFDSKRFYELEVRVLRRERVTVDAGTFDAIVIQPVMQSEGVFSSSGAIYIWISDDLRRIPVKVEAKVFIGSVRAELTGGTY
jgi:hypothetical protein